VFADAREEGVSFTQSESRQLPITAIRIAEPTQRTASFQIAVTSAIARREWHRPVTMDEMSVKCGDGHIQHDFSADLR